MVLDMAESPTELAPAHPADVHTRNRANKGDLLLCDQVEGRACLQDHRFDKFFDTYTASTSGLAQF